MSNDSDDREFEIVVWGATGYTGKLVAAYLASAPFAAGLRWAIAGRDQSKLEAVRAELKLAPEIGLVLADAGDPTSLDAMCRRTHLISLAAKP